MFALLYLGSSDDVAVGSSEWWIFAGISIFLVFFGGIMSGLTLGLMAISPLDVEVLLRSGTDEQKRDAAAILPVLKNQHRLLVTLLLCNAAAMEALPIFLDKMANPVIAIIVSVTLVLLFGEIIPQAICSRFGLSVGASCVWLVNILLFLCFPVAYPIGKLLDAVLGHEEPYFARHQLKALVSIHARDEGRGGDLTRDETLIISGALDLTTKSAEQAMTPIESTFSLELESKLNRALIEEIVRKGHSRIPIYKQSPTNIIGVLLTKSLIAVRAEDEIPISRMNLRRIIRMDADMPLYDVLNEFQEGNSHMAVVVRRNKLDSESSVAVTVWQEPEEEEVSRKVYSNDLFASEITEPLLPPGTESSGKLGPKRSSVVGRVAAGEEFEDRQLKKCKSGGSLTGWRKRADSWKLNLLDPANGVSFESREGEEVIGIITLEDVIEELLQEEIIDETDEFIDVHRKIQVVSKVSSLLQQLKSKQ